MARRLRVEYAGAVYHVMARGNDGRDIFVTDGLRERFLETLGEACAQTGWLVHAYALMGNHYHLLLETPEANLVVGMKWLQGTYTQRFHAVRRAHGHLFQGRYKSVVVDPDSSSYLPTLSTYIHLNPYRARLCGLGCKSGLKTYRWSSYPAYLRPKRPEWLEISRVLQSVGIQGTGKRERERYRHYLERRMAHEADPVNARAVVDERELLQASWCLGEERFQKEVLARMGKIGGDNLRGQQRRAHGEETAEALLAQALEGLHLNEQEIRDRRSTDAEKQAVAWLLKRHTTVSGVWVAQRLSMGHRVNASRAISRFDRSTERKVTTLKKMMLQCTG